MYLNVATLRFILYKTICTIVNFTFCISIVFIIAVFFVFFLLGCDGGGWVEFCCMFVMYLILENKKRLEIKKK